MIEARDRSSGIDVPPVGGAFDFVDRLVRMHERVQSVDGLARVDTSVPPPCPCPSAVICVFRSSRCLLVRSRTRGIVDYSNRVIVISVVAQKGGAGKTTLSLGLGCAAGAAGLSAVVVDLDPQATAASWGDRRAADCADGAVGAAFPSGAHS